MDPSQNLESAAMEGLWEQLDMDLSHGSTVSTSALDGAEAEMSFRRLSPGRDSEPVCCDSSTSWSALYLRD